MVVAVFSVIDLDDRVRLFKKTFLIANVSQNVVLGMFFLTLMMQILTFQRESFDGDSIPLRKFFLPPS